VLGADVLDEPPQPGLERRPRRQIGHLVRRVGERGDLAEVERLDQVVPGREVAIQRADTDPGPTSDVLQRGAGAVFREGLAAGGDEGVEVASGIGAARPPLLQRRRRTVLATHRAVLPESLGRPLQNGGTLR
jgi:hypothetical protein